MQTSRKHSAKEVFARLWQEVSTFYGELKIFGQLYQHSTERVALLNRSARAAFRMIEDVFLDHIIIVLARLTEPSTFGKYHNLSLDQLIEAMETEGRTDAACKARQRLKSLVSSLDALRAHRHKRIAHKALHLPSSSNDNPLPPLTMGTVQDITDALAEIMNTCELDLQGSTTDYEAVFFGGHGDGDTLIARLHDAELYHDLRSAARKVMRADNPFIAVRAHPTTGELQW